jgi:hypothetical protein
MKPFRNENTLVLGETFQEMDSSMRRIFEKFNKSQDPYYNKVGEALQSAHLSLMELAERQSPNFAKEYKLVKGAYARMKRINEAATSVGAHEGVFTPNQLLGAVRKKTSTNKFASGEGFNQAAIESAKDAFSKTVPDSGTPLRLGVNAAALGGMGAAGVTGGPALGAIAAYLAGAGAYTPVGQTIAQAALAGGQGVRVPIRKGLEKLAPFAALAGAGAGVNSK